MPAIDHQAVDAGNPGAVLRLADAYLSGALGKKYEPSIGIEVLKTATEDGVPGAAVALADAYISGKGTTRDIPAALKILETATASGDVAAVRRL